MSAAGDARRALPSVGALLLADPVAALCDRFPREHVVEAARAAVAAAREAPRAAPATDDAWARTIEAIAAARARPSLRPVHNATGVVLHTNLGRAPLADAALDAIRDVAGGATNLEYDLERGERGSRWTHCASLLTELTGAEDALVVNNCAGALVLALAALAGGRDAIVSRGELVEIGGSFRVPDIMAESGARLVEVGTTNRTHLGDYARAMRPETGAIVKVHRSNFEMSGFVAEASVRDLAPLAAEYGAALLHDFGSGLLVSLEPYGLRGEPTAREAVAAGATAVLMSGDKLLGGPQAGIVVGRSDAVARMRRHPLSRALRVDKLTLAALGATLRIYRDGADRAVREIPALAMLAAPADAIRARVERLASRVARTGRECEVQPTEATVGGGAFPGARIPSFALAIPGDATLTERALRLGHSPVVGRVEHGRVLLDLRSVPAAHDDRLGDAVVAALAAS